MGSAGTTGFLQNLLGRAVNLWHLARGGAHQPEAIGAGHVLDLTVIPMRRQDAEDILSWRYDAPYDFYNPPSEGPRDHFISQFLKPSLNFHVVLDQYQQMLGFCSYGIDGQVPGGRYDDDALDIGLGMKPDQTGKGLGEHFFKAIVEHAENKFQPDHYRLTVARFNARAMRLYQRFGFDETECFQEPVQQVEYAILMRPA